ncbi:MAG TPA: hypothetical protein VJU52_11845, partial [Flavobacterium sp.]|nr:hypothetical protein [Flavobacterium sp.]
MKKTIFYTTKSVHEYCFTFPCCYNAGFNAFIYFLTKQWCYGWRQRITLPLLLLTFFMMCNESYAQGSIRGIVPVQIPRGGSGAEGDAFAHQPVGTLYEGVGDLFDSLHPTVAGHGVINPFTGQVLYPGSTFFLQDPYVNDPTIFTLSNKINDNPNTYTWGAGSSPNKNEIQNAGAHFSLGDSSIMGGVIGADGNFVPGTTALGNPDDWWCLFAGDRQVTNGSSYIDFEFLQKTLTITGVTSTNPITGAITGGSGGFTTEGTQGGRTVGDILVTIEFTQGGGEANAIINVWTETSPGVFKYVVHPNTEFFGGIYITNNTQPTHVPFDVYGSDPNNTGAGGDYAVNQWAEGAINLTQVLKAVNIPCFTISTVFIRTRSSGNSEQSELKDFPGAPIQLNLNSTKLEFKHSAPVALQACGTPVADIVAAFNAWRDGFGITVHGTDDHDNAATLIPATLNLSTYTATQLAQLICDGIEIPVAYSVGDACNPDQVFPSSFSVLADVTPPVLSALPEPSTIQCPAAPSFTTP